MYKLRSIDNETFVVSSALLRKSGYFKDLVEMSPPNLSEKISLDVTGIILTYLLKLMRHGTWKVVAKVSEEYQEELKRELFSKHV